MRIVAQHQAEQTEITFLHIVMDSADQADAVLHAPHVKNGAALRFHSAASHGGWASAQVLACRPSEEQRLLSAMWVGQRIVLTDEKGNVWRAVLDRVALPDFACLSCASQLISITLYFL